MTTIQIEHAGLIAEVLADNFCPMFGYNLLDREPSEAYVRGNRLFFEMGIEQKLGIFDMIVKDVRVSVYAEIMLTQEIWVIVSLRYNHPGGGSNGSTIGTVWIDPVKRKVSAYRPEGGQIIYNTCLDIPSQLYQLVFGG